MTKKHYYVTVDTQDIREISIPDSGIEYEIIADAKEIEMLKKLFMKKNNYAELAIEYLVKPFDEWGADAERSAYSDHLITIYHELYKFGTEDTKAKIKKLGVIK
ncbi:MAG: hypothetical protein ACQEWU_04000 [Bacillota bacterium]|uniref:Uncharacterized protein n=1 Tax=Virgibacillus salarius TaxID=447199 RepID=A0A941IB31_9BACI|nr:MULTISPECIES: hypothetical protein [Bacillaceae]NAZ07600.1 hypothetical protein [Agaribacter marinus]MBR7794880.1 hypothetical protein [Virgibacillus salarius]MCC2249293.1 hypothetical protein [Virgibacillus sp. AGTR]MDY7043881.1 hypothetical protein [Virgibacillus sp. M23]QRZ17327.1 hypothetical protein JUJ52_16340 [Virgibacillus sp. AGTR]